MTPGSCLRVHSDPGPANHRKAVPLLLKLGSSSLFGYVVARFSLACLWTSMKRSVLARNPQGSLLASPVHTQGSAVGSHWPRLCAFALWTPWLPATSDRTRCVTRHSVAQMVPPLRRTSTGAAGRRRDACWSADILFAGTVHRKDNPHRCHRVTEGRRWTKVRMELVYCLPVV